MKAHKKRTKNAQKMSEKIVIQSICITIGADKYLGKYKQGEDV